jgi:hypothetical protein
LVEITGDGYSRRTFATFARVELEVYQSHWQLRLEFEASTTFEQLRPSKSVSTL